MAVGEQDKACGGLLGGLGGALCSLGLEEGHRMGGRGGAPWEAAVQGDMWGLPVEKDGAERGSNVSAAAS